MKHELKRWREAQGREAGEALRRYLSADPVELPGEALEQGCAAFRRMAPRRGPVLRIVIRRTDAGLELLNSTGAQTRWPGALPDAFLAGRGRLTCVLQQTFPDMQVFAALGEPAARGGVILLHARLVCAAPAGVRITLYHNGKLLQSATFGASGCAAFSLPGKGVFHAIIGTDQGAQISIFAG
jgi:hypothetical protein